MVQMKAMETDIKMVAALSLGAVMGRAEDMMVHMTDMYTKKIAAIQMVRVCVSLCVGEGEE